MESKDEILTRTVMPEFELVSGMLPNVSALEVQQLITGGSIDGPFYQEAHVDRYPARVEFILGGGGGTHVLDMDADDTIEDAKIFVLDAYRDGVFLSDPRAPGGQRYYPPHLILQATVWPSYEEVLRAEDKED